MNCPYCDESLSADERHPRLADGGRIHVECYYRMVAGSVGHHLGLCGCPGGLDLMEDPPGMSRRQAARAAVEVFKLRAMVGAAEEPFFVCPACRSVSYHPLDVTSGYCGHCRTFVGKDHLPPGMVEAARAKARHLGMMP